MAFDLVVSDGGGIFLATDDVLQQDPQGIRLHLDQRLMVIEFGGEQDETLLRQEIDPSLLPPLAAATEITLVRMENDLPAEGYVLPLTVIGEARA